MRVWKCRLDDENRPPQWRNKQSADEESKKSQGYPIIDDFEVVLEILEGDDEEPEPNNGHYWVEFFSETRGYIMSFSPWIEDELLRNDFKIPLNYLETDQGGELLIHTRGQFVFIEEGVFKKPEYFATPWFQILWERIPSGKYLKALQFPVLHAWLSYKVPKERYIAEWELAIEACKNLG